MVVEAVLIGGVVCGVFLLLIWLQSPAAADVSPFRSTEEEESERRALDNVVRFRGRS